MKPNEDKTNGFSVALGLTDYVNPILYTITCSTIILNINKVMVTPWSIIYILGVVLSLIFGFMIPTVKLLVGLGKMQFKLPVSYVACVNTGIFISGLMLIKATVCIPVFLGIILLSAVMLSLIYTKTKKFNNIAVLIGGVGYLLIYISLIRKSLENSLTAPIVLYAFAICLYVMLIGIGIKANLKDARVHWVIEISNIICQFLVASGTILLFAGL